MTDGLLAVIAVATVVAAIVQVAAAVFAVRAARGTVETIDRFERDIRPIIANLHAATANIARATSVATSQVERADRMLAGLSVRVDETASIVQHYALTPFREGAAVLKGAMAALRVLRDIRRRPRRNQTETEDDESLFVG